MIELALTIMKIHVQLELVREVEGHVTKMAAEGSAVS